MTAKIRSRAANRTCHLVLGVERRARGIAAVIALGALALSTNARAENSVAIGHVEAAPGDSGVIVLVTARNVEAIHGYSLAVSFPADVLSVRGFGLAGTHVAELEPELVAPRMDNDLGIATLGVILNYSASSDVSEISPTSDGVERILARLQFDVRPGARGGEYAIRLEDGLGTPSVYNRFTVRGRSVTPELHDGAVSVRGSDILCVEKKVAFAGATPNLPIFAYAMHPDPLSGYSIGLVYDCRSGFLNLTEASLAQTDVQFLLGSLGLVEFFESNVDASLAGGKCRSQTGVIFDYVPPASGAVLVPSTDGPYEQSVLRYRFSVGALARSEAEYQDLRLENFDTPGAVNNVFVVSADDGAESIFPVLVDGKIYFSTGAVHGRVVDRLTGAPVAGAKIVTDPEEYHTTTLGNGTFKLANVIPGDYHVRIEASGFYDGFFAELHASGAANDDDWGDLAIYSVPASGDVFRRGFVNSDQKADISDSVWLLNWLFKGGEEPLCLLAADINDDNKNDISDSIYLLTWLFGGGTPPPPPFESCGSDPTSPLGCEVNLSCP